MKPLSRLLAAAVLLCGALVAPATSLAAAAAAPALAASGPSAVRLAKDAVCTRCHDESEAKPILSLYQTKHGVTGNASAPTCQSCHGESKQHLGGNTTGKGRPKPDIVFGAKKTTAGYAPNDAHEQGQVCLSCHKDGKRTHWAGSQHESRDVPCSSCHSLHKPQDPMLTRISQPEVCYSCHKTQRAQTHRTSTHPLDAGKMACSDCHNPHGSTGPTLLVKNSINETCYTCHAEKRGPFLWEHSPVTDDCSTCHTPHGSTNAPLLKTRTPWLCQECHSGDHGAQVNSGANLQNGLVTSVNGTTPLASAAARAQMGARACLNCHVLVHGSNHPAGSKFQR